MQKKSDTEREKQKLDLELDRELEATFPASDALKVTRRQPEKPTKPTRSGGKAQRNS